MQSSLLRLCVAPGRLRFLDLVVSGLELPLQVVILRRGQEIIADHIAAVGDAADDAPAGGADRESRVERGPAEHIEALWVEDGDDQQQNGEQDRSEEHTSELQ